MIGEGVIRVPTGPWFAYPIRIRLRSTVTYSELLTIMNSLQDGPNMCASYDISNVGDSRTVCQHIRH